MTQIVNRGKVELTLHRISAMIAGLISDMESSNKKSVTLAKSQEQWLQPKIQLCDGNLHVNDLIIPLRSRPKTLALIEAFMSRPGLRLSKQEIIQLVYQSDGQAGEISPRLQFSYYQSMLKLISRSRSLLDQAINQSLSDRWIEWFVHDDLNKQWILYRINGLG